MARDWCWLEKKRNAYVIRYNDPVLKKANGIDPKVGIAVPKDDQGNPITSKVLANAALDAFRARNIGPAPKRKPGSVALPPRYTIQQLALKWFHAHPKHRTRDAYMHVVQKLVAPERLGVDHPDQLTARLVKDYKQNRGFVGVHKDCAYLRSILNWAQDEDDLLDRPLCPRMLKALSQPQSKRSTYPVMTADEYAASMAEAKRWGPHHYAFAHCTSTYGWRPSTACMVLVGDVNLADSWIVLTHVKDVSKDKDHEPVEHPLHPETVELLRPLMEGRDPGERLFLHGAVPWRMGHTGGADQFTDWYRRTIKPLAPKAGNSNAWKRYAVHRMTNGMAPWPERLDDERIRIFTGHEDVQVVSRYRKTNREEMRRAVGFASPSDSNRSADDEEIVVVWGGVDARQAPTNPDERVSYGT